MRRIARSGCHTADGAIRARSALVSHESVASHIEETLKSREEELRQRYAERLGELPAPVEATTETTTSTGIPTIEQLSAMNQDQLEALERETPGIIDKVLRSADQLTP